MRSANASPTEPPERPGTVLVAGASGFLGRAVVRALRAGGRPVVGLVHREEAVPIVAAEGATAVVGDVLHRPSLLRAARGCTDFVHLASAWNDAGAPPQHAERVRVEGARNLVETARAIDGARLVIGSGYWVYAGSSQPIDEDSALDPAGESGANYAAEQVALDTGTAAGLEALVVRPGMVYGDGAWLRSMAEAIREGSYRVVDEGRNSWSFVALSDTGAAFRTVLEHGRPGSIYNVVDGEPATWGEFARSLAEELGRPAPPSIDTAAAEQLYGETVTRHLLANRSLRPLRLRALDWEPKVPSFREGLPALVRTMRWT